MPLRTLESLVVAAYQGEGERKVEKVEALGADGMVVVRKAGRAAA